MKRLFLMLLFAAACTTLSAQTLTVEMPAAEPDSLACDTLSVTVKTTPWRPIREVLPETDSLSGAAVTVVEHGTAKWAVAEFAAATDSLRTISGYRVRIFSDKRQNAKASAVAAQALFRENYSAQSYLVYENPYFLVTCGNCATMEEALMLLSKIKVHFPKAFIVSSEIPLSAL